MEYTKPVMWDGQSDFPGTWVLTIKIDGIRVFVDEYDRVVSRNGKPLYNMDHLKEKIRSSMPEGCEVFLGTFKGCFKEMLMMLCKRITTQVIFLTL